MEVSGQLHALAALPPGKEPLVPIGYGAWRAPEPVWTRWLREKFPSSPKVIPKCLKGFTVSEVNYDSEQAQRA
jgi:hypothetical protein